MSLVCNKVEHFSPHPRSFVPVYACLSSDACLMCPCTALQRGLPLQAVFPRLPCQLDSGRVWLIGDTRGTLEGRMVKPGFPPPFSTLGFACCGCGLRSCQTSPLGFQLSLDNAASWGPRTLSPTFVPPAEGMRVVSSIVLTVPCLPLSFSNTCYN